MTEKQPLTVQCPSCGEPVVWDAANEYRPFCSARCKDLDFIGWAEEEHRIAGDENYDDLLSDDLSGEFPKQ